LSVGFLASVCIGSVYIYINDFESDFNILKYLNVFGNRMAEPKNVAAYGAVFKEPN
jgi:hypothetical protein